MAVDLNGRVLVVTGGSSGIGAATAMAAARAGMRVVLAARRREKLEEVAERVRRSGGEALAVEADVAGDEAVRRLVDQTVERFGRLDAMFANAGYGGFGPLFDEDPAEARRMWEINYFGTVRCLRAAAEVMRRQGSGGHLLACSSIVGRTGLPYSATYAATKAAQHALLASLALEIEPEGIHVSCVYPVGTRTEFFEVVANRDGRGAAGETTPRFFQQSAEHVANRIVRCLRRPRPEVWPSRLAHLGAAVWTLCPRLHRFSFRRHAWDARRVLRDEGQPR